MTATQSPRQCDLAIVGGGAAGVLVALHALRTATAALHVVVFEPASALAQGIAYATPWPEHLLNVPAGRMSALPDAPDDFLDYLLQVDAFPGMPRDAVAAEYAPRRCYAAYLQARLEQAQATSAAQLSVVHEAVTALQPGIAMQQLTLADGDTWQARQVVLACGNSMRPLPVTGADALPPGKVVDAWDYDGVRLLAGDGDLAIIGSGLSMADSVVALANAGHRGRIHVLSRHALLPLPHAHGGTASFDPGPLPGLPLRQALRALRGHARDAVAQGLPWQSVMERIRPLGKALWQTLDAADQRRFLRHGVRHWDVHRHRIAEEVHVQLRDALADGRLQLHRVRLQGVVETESGLRLSALSHGAAVQWDLGALVNATGVETRAEGLRNPLLRQLLAEGIARPGPHGLGLDSQAAGDRLIDADGNADDAIGVLGSLRIGTLWESLAVPELRQQAEDAARHAVRELEAAMP